MGHNFRELLMYMLCEGVGIVIYGMRELTVSALDDWEHDLYFEWSRLRLL